MQFSLIFIQLALSLVTAAPLTEDQVQLSRRFAQQSTLGANLVRRKEFDGEATESLETTSDDTVVDELPEFDTTEGVQVTQNLCCHKCEKPECECIPPPPPQPCPPPVECCDTCGKPECCCPKPPCPCEVCDKVSCCCPKPPCPCDVCGKLKDCLCAKKKCHESHKSECVCEPAPCK